MSGEKKDRKCSGWTGDGELAAHERCGRVPREDSFRCHTSPTGLDDSHLSLYRNYIGYIGTLEMPHLDRKIKVCGNAHMPLRTTREDLAVHFSFGMFDYLLRNSPHPFPLALQDD